MSAASGKGKGMRVYDMLQTYSAHLNKLRIKVAHPELVGSIFRVENGKATPEHGSGHGFRSLRSDLPEVIEGQASSNRECGEEFRIILIRR